MSHTEKTQMPKWLVSGSRDYELDWQNPNHRALMAKWAFRYWLIRAAVQFAFGAVLGFSAVAFFAGVLAP